MKVTPIGFRASGMKPWRSIVALGAVVAVAAPACGGVFLDWSTSFSSSIWHFNNTSAAGTITGVSPNPGFAARPGTWGMPTAMTTQPPLTNGFQIHGLRALGSSVDFTFSPGYAWGAGGEMLIGNIHNHYEYTISAWDFSGTPIDVNAWNWLAEYPATAPGTAGYFSTSSTQRSAAGLSSKFFVNDPLAGASGGQGGVVHLNGLVGIGKIRMTLSNSALAPNPQQVDLMFFNVAPPGIPAPAGSMALAGAGFLAMSRRRLPTGTTNSAA